jgi:hypothetical protein
VKSISTQQILDFMREGQAYSRASFYREFPDVDAKLVNDALQLLTSRGDIWNGNMLTYVKFAPKSTKASAVPQICPSHSWGDLTGYESNLRRFRGAAEATRGEGYAAPEFGGNAMTGRASNESFQQRAVSIRVMQ